MDLIDGAACGGILFAEMGIDRTNDCICGHITCAVRGFSEDNRSLFESP